MYPNSLLVITVIIKTKKLYYHGTFLIVESERSKKNTRSNLCLVFVVMMEVCTANAKLASKFLQKSQTKKLNKLYDISDKFTKVCLKRVNYAPPCSSRVGYNKCIHSILYYNIFTLKMCKICNINVWMSL